MAPDAVSQRTSTTWPEAATSSKAAVICSKRGRVIIVDRDKLEEITGDSYGLPEAEYRRLIGRIGRTSVVLPFNGKGQRRS